MDVWLFLFQLSHVSVSSQHFLLLRKKHHDDDNSYEENI